MAQASQPDPELVHKGLALHEAGKSQAALDLYQQFLKTMPDHPEVLNFCALAYYDLGQQDQALEFFTRATDTEPGMLQAWNNKGLLLQSMGRLDEALQAFQHITTSLDQPPPDAHHNVGNVLYQLGNTEQALSEFSRTTQLQPGNVSALGKLAICHLDLGQWQPALTAIDTGLISTPSNTGLLALKSVALKELGKDKEWRHLVDFDRLIRHQTFDLAAGYASLDDLNNAIVDHVLSHPTLVYEPSDNTTTKGHQSGDLMKSDKGPIAALETMIRNSVDDYIKTLTPDADHPFLSSPPPSWTINAWATILSTDGHQASHIHRDAWLSGCYYVTLPDLMGAENKDRQGWIVFGEPADYPVDKSRQEPRFYKPETSSLFLFPSYFYHQTVPFTSDQKRISIAFDVIPLDA